MRQLCASTRPDFGQASARQSANPLFPHTATPFPHTAHPFPHPTPSFLRRQESIPINRQPVSFHTAQFELTQSPLKSKAKAKSKSSAPDNSTLSGASYMCVNPPGLRASKRTTKRQPRYAHIPLRHSRTPSRHSYNPCPSSLHAAPSFLRKQESKALNRQPASIHAAQFELTQSPLKKAKRKQKAKATPPTIPHCRGRLWFYLCVSPPLIRRYAACAAPCAPCAIQPCAAQS